jgi:uncharacterized membrane protein/Mg-chelatase subunit ChlD
MGLELQYLSWWWAAAIYAAVAAVVVLLGLWSLAGTSPVRKWVAIGARLLVLLLVVLIIAGARYTRKHEDLELIVVNDASTSMDLVSQYPGRGTDAANIQDALRRYYASMLRDPTRKPNDKVGVVSFRHYARVDQMPSNGPYTPPTMQWAEGTGSDVAAGIRMALATFSPDSMRRIVLVSDGNSNLGDLDGAIDAARAQGVPIDVVPLRYDVQNDVLVERFNAPEWRRQNEVFDVEVVMQSTNVGPATGSLRVKHLTAGDERFLDVDPATPGVQDSRKVTLNPGLNKFVVRVPAQAAGGVHRFQAIFTPDIGSGGATQVTDAVARNNTAEAFTVVRGRGQVLFVDGSLTPGSAEAPRGEQLFRTLLRELTAEQQPAERQLEPVRRIPVEQFPRNLADLQGYYAIVLYNVARGGQVTETGNVGGLSLDQDAMLRSYVHDMGGGLLMIGGDNTFGAGGWTNSELEKVLPVNMDVPAQRNVGKGALALIVHSCEMPDGNYWGQQCAISAIKSLSVRDEVGVISYGWGGNASQNGIGGAQFDVPFQELRNRESVIDAVKRMRPGDMPSFDDAIALAVKGAGPTPRGLMHIDAKHRHIVIISDGDPASPQEQLLKLCEAYRISVSTITVYPHTRGSKKVPPVMSDLPERLKGKFYGPIEDNPQQLPQLFIKEAQIVKRTLIQENLTAGLRYTIEDPSDELLRLVPRPYPVVRGMVLTTRKNDPKVIVPLAAESWKDPVLAYWQSGLGKAAVWTADAHDRWGSRWVNTDGYATLFAGIIRKIARPPQSSDYSITTRIEGDKGEIILDAMNDKGEAKNFLRINATVLAAKDKDGKSVQLVQIAPGKYRGTFDVGPADGPVVVAASVEGEAPIFGGAVKSGTIEDRALRSNDARLREVAERTGGRELPPFDVASAALFDRAKLPIGSSPKPIWQQLLPVLLALIIFDVAIRRIAWDWAATKKLAASAAERVRSFTGSRKVESKETLEALRRKREEVAETRLRVGETASAGPPPIPGVGRAAGSVSARPDPSAKFTGEVEGDIGKVVGGATDKPIPPAPKKPPKGAATAEGGHLGGLMAAKKRAQQQIKEKEQGEG